MSTVFQAKPQSGHNIAEMSHRLAFQKKLQSLTNKIHATSNIDEIMLELSQDICSLFDADRLTIYTMSDDQPAIISKVKTGLASFKDLKLPINEQSIAGYVALHKKIVNIRDVYDDNELRSHSAQLRFLKEVDRRTGYRTKQMLVAPIVDGANGELIGIVQVINAKNGHPFSTLAEEGATHLAETLAIALKQRSRPTAMLRGKYDRLVTDAVLSAEEMELATRSARRKNLDIEDILLDEFQVKPHAIGEALGKFFGVPYESFKPDRIKPLDLLKNLKRDFVESSHWVPIDDAREGLVVLTTDPERVRASKVVGNIFPKHRIAYRVCTRREFDATLDLFFGAGGGDSASIGDLLSSMDEEDQEGGGGSVDEASLAQDNELVKLVNKIIVDAYHQGASDIHIEPYPGKGKTEVRFRKDGSLQPYISVPPGYRSAIAARIKIMCDLDISEKRKPQDGKIKFKKFGPLDIELRVATIPSAGGIEDIVMRILSAGEPIPIDKLALSARNLRTVKETVSKPYGLFFVCGPTGSGKTTTLHSVLG
ncbi:MAG: ATPase, T2SS/T4P/T4SS family, partial [Burkholderiales bacterium]